MLTSSLHHEFSWSERALFLKEKLRVELSKNTVTWSGWDCLCEHPFRQAFPPWGTMGRWRVPGVLTEGHGQICTVPYESFEITPKYFPLFTWSLLTFFLEQYVLVFSYAKYEDHFVECQGSLSAPRARTPYVGLNLQHPKHRVDFTCVFLPFTGGKKNQVTSPNSSYMRF